MALVFLDTETVGLADDCDIWEIGLIVRNPAPDVDSPEGAAHVDVERSWMLRPDLTNAEPAGLRIGRYYQRIGNLAGDVPGVARETSPNRHPDGGGYIILPHTTTASIAGDARIVRDLYDAVLANG